MKRLPKVLPEWTRKIWVSDQARRVWQERLNNINEAWTRIERWSVVEGARDSCLSFCVSKDLPEISRWAAKHGLVCLPIARVGVTDQYSAVPKTPTDNNWQYRIVITKPELIEAWYQAWEATGETEPGHETHNARIGQLLGFPPCCVDFFERIWVQERWLDTTWPMAWGDQKTEEEETTLEIRGPPEANILWRWMGVRQVTHLPCSFTCEPTVRLAQEFARVARARGFSEWWTYIDQILRWPVEWSALHGIALIRTPILTVSSRTDLTADRYVVRYRGTEYPDEGAVGRAFPYKDKGNVKIFEHRSFQRALEVVGQDDPRDWEDNGFSSEAAMDTAHDVLLDAVGDFVVPNAQVLDLGCGNGALLRRACRDGVPHGVERDKDRCKRALLAQSHGFFRWGEIKDLDLWPEKYDLVFLMPGRLLELEEPERKRVINHLREHAHQVVFYAYGDWLQKHKDLKGLMLQLDLGDWQEVKWAVSSNAAAVRCHIA